jgi:diaminohydroxyphosphoribosylaminopyrimidine deaminase/5-amino-6-(5-phosphoribosylamino)uracil reductase
MQDPNPMVDGRGFDALRRAGIEVEVGLLEDQARRINESFIRWHEHGLPLVTLKAAISADGMIAADGGASRWITGEAARRFAHRLRACHDAVLVGAGTVRRDDPRLTVRLGGSERTRLRVVLSRSLELDPAASLFAPVAEGADRTVVFTTTGAPRERIEALAAAEVVPLAASDDETFLREALGRLAARGVQSVLVEGGAVTLASFVRTGLAQRFALFCSSRLIGAHGGVPLLAGPSASTPADAPRIEREQLIPLGEDLLILGRPRHAAVAPTEE